MKRLLCAFLISIMAVCLTLAAVQPIEASPKTITVPNDYPTITAALKYAISGDTILVKEGTYYEPRLEISQSINLIGENPNTTIISSTDNPPWVNGYGNFPPPIALTMNVTANNVKVQGFSITNGGPIILKGYNNIFDGNFLATYVECTGSYNNITANVISGSSSFSSSGDYNTINFNNITNAGLSISGNGNTVAENNLNSLFAGLTIAQGSNNNIWGNRLANGGGLAVTMGYNNTFYSNSVTNSSVGVMIGGSQTDFSYQTSGPWTGNNTLYHNNFINNTNQVWTGYVAYGTNFFDNGKEGNYWSDYVGTDVNRDGIGDTPYIIDANRSDHYPLMLPFELDNNTIRLPSPPPTSTPLLTSDPTPSPSIPEFPSSIILPLIIGTLFFALMLRKRVKV